MAARPAFTAVAIASLALGIGANTAIFSLWYTVVRAPLPGVERPDELVMLTNPGATGMWRGQWTTPADGPRSWVTYAEFEALRDRASSFSVLTASQSSWSSWPAVIDGGAVEDVHGRFVSGDFFRALGVGPSAGRLFTADEDRGEPAIAVISHAYWQRRFGGVPAAVGRTLTIRGTPVTIVGVTPDGFVGETAGQTPDLWLPLRLQPRLTPGNDWLQDLSADKTMWLHVIGRLRPGVTLAQADIEANAILHAELEVFYGGVAPDRRQALLDQRLRLVSSARGASATVQGLAASITTLLAAAGVLLLIACANLANLLLARSVSRRGEIAVRVSLGAGRAQILRLLMVDSLAVAAVGAVAALGLAALMHQGLVRLLQQADPSFATTFVVDVPVLLFTAGTMLVAALAIGAMPAITLSRSLSLPTLQDVSRGAIGSRHELRAGRWLVAAQLALSLPLLVAAGLLVRTVYNLQHPELGFRSEQLVLARVDIGVLASDPVRREQALRATHSRIEQIAGVERATFSQLGLFGGGFSNSPIVIDGSDRTLARPEDVDLDRVGPGYFTTLGVPIALGRDIDTRDDAVSPRVCVINAAFAEQYFKGRNPLGARITTVDDVDGRTSYEVVGVAGNVQIHDVRTAVEPRFFVPSAQRRSAATNRTFVIRTQLAPTVLAAALREAVADAHPQLSVATIESLDERLGGLTAEDRAIAMLSLVFGVVALLLAVVGLYGVLSYGINRRATEMAIRIALGARGTRVIAMILQESAGVVAAGLAAGGLLSFFGTRVLAQRLYGVAAGDPLTAVTALTTLVLAAFAASYLPALRASRVSPMAALHRG
jgi:predicted permease